MLTQWRAAHPTTKRVLFIMRMSNNRPMVAGTGTAADAVIRLAGGSNPAAFEGYKILDQEALIGLQPDAVLTMEQDAPQVRAALLGNAGFRLTPAGRNQAIIAMEGERLLGFGPARPMRHWNWPVAWAARPHDRGNVARNLAFRAAGRPADTDHAAGP
ncbi:ABC transporter substrate-binding protein [Komagataeibacter rhaeticus]|nr:ABC transporter substrate-binding protein [Komagataeibacter rhaeticus]